MRALHFIDRWINRIANTLLVVMFSGMLFLAVLQVALRHFSNGSLLWGDTAARQLVIWVGFFGAILACDGQKHFNIALIPRLLPPRYRGWVERGTTFFAAAISLLLGNASMTFLNVGIDPQSIFILDIPARLAAAIVPAGFYLMTLKFLLRTILGPVPGQPPGPDAASEVRR